MTVDSLLTTLWVIGITAEAMTAALAAGRQRMDLFGVVLLACVTALGGGTVRDLLLGHYPLRWVAEPGYLLVIIAAALITVLMSFLMDYFRTLFLVLDAIGLSAFTIFGAQVALDQGHGAIIAIVAAVITGVFGGVLRDILSDRVPLVFSEDLYASVAIIGTSIYLVMLHFQVPEMLAVLITVGVCITIRMIAIFFHVSLPVFEYSDREIPRDPANRLSNSIFAWRRKYYAKPRTMGPRRERGPVASEDKATKDKDTEGTGTGKRAHSTDQAEQGE